MRKIRSIFFSDTHLGSQFAQVEQLLKFIKFIDENRPEKVYIVGDFIDGWKFIKNDWHWSKECNLIIRKIFSLLKHNTEVYYVIGNHDEFLRSFIENDKEIDLAGLKIANEFIHETPTGKKLLVIHGDKFDAAIRYGSNWICNLGDLSYDFLLRINFVFNKMRRLIGLKYWSFSKMIKHQFKDVVKHISSFENILVNYAKEQGCSGVICGHIHTAEMKKIMDIMYYNCGDWVESGTAIIEYDNGQLELFVNSETEIDFAKTSKFGKCSAGR